MVTVPGAVPVTIPVAMPIVATATLLLLHMPPGVASLRVVVVPGQTILVPKIVAGGAFTVTVVVALPAPTV